MAACGIVAIGSRGCVSVSAMSDQLHDLLAEILAGKQADKGLGCGGQALRDGLAVLDASAGDALGQLLEGRGQNSRCSDTMKPRNVARETSNARTLWIAMSCPS